MKTSVNRSITALVTIATGDTEHEAPLGVALVEAVGLIAEDVPVTIYRQPGVTMLMYLGQKSKGETAIDGDPAVVGVVCALLAPVEAAKALRG